MHRHLFILWLLNASLLAAVAVEVNKEGRILAAVVLMRCTVHALYVCQSIKQAAANSHPCLHAYMQRQHWHQQDHIHQGRKHRQRQYHKSLINMAATIPPRRYWQRQRRWKQWQPLFSRRRRRRYSQTPFCLQQQCYCPLSRLLLPRPSR